MFKVIALMGKAGSGKDALLHELIRQCPDANEMISCTTRPIREGEIHGVNYFYMTPEEFGARVLNGEMNVLSLIIGSMGQVMRLCVQIV